MHRRLLARYTVVSALSAVAALLVAWFNSAILRWPVDVIVGMVGFGCVVGIPVLAGAWSRQYQAIVAADDDLEVRSSPKRVAHTLALLTSGVFALFFGAALAAFLGRTGIGVSVSALGAVAGALAYAVLSNDRTR